MIIMMKFVDLLMNNQFFVHFWFYWFLILRILKLNLFLLIEFGVSNFNSQVNFTLEWSHLIADHSLNFDCLAATVNCDWIRSGIKVYSDNFIFTLKYFRNLESNFQDLVSNPIFNSVDHSLAPAKSYSNLLIDPNLNP